MTYGNVEPASRASTPALQIYMAQPLNLMGFKRVRRAGDLAGLACRHFAINKVWHRRSMTPLKFNKMCRSELKVHKPIGRSPITAADSKSIACINNAQTGTGNGRGSRQAKGRAQATVPAVQGEGVSYHVAHTVLTFNIALCTMRAEKKPEMANDNANEILSVWSSILFSLLFFLAIFKGNF